jgi:hypothetical protein
MIVRILGEGQYDVPAERLDDLNKLDDDLVGAIDANDDNRFKESLKQLLDGVRAGGLQVPDDYLGPSEFVLPGPDTTLEEVRDLLGDEGLVPG